MLSATTNAAKFAQNCPKTKLWNSTKNQDFIIFQKQKFVRVEEALEHVSTVWIFNPRIFNTLYLLPKNGLCMWISAYPLVKIDDFLKVPHLVWAWDFVDMYLINLGTRIWSSQSIPTRKNAFFGPQNFAVFLEHWKKKPFFFNFQPFDLANGMEWMYKIWWTCKHIS
jgi:hypothetical protein